MDNAVEMTTTKATTSSMVVATTTTTMIPTNTALLPSPR
ncbi:hypothetical protein F441_22481 [Phytophthora nicotianae CJ01A1]|uniref:Uncharacterized protein n=1 Tax=Phytophthora nicotianae CJ01A1 TaxID=1317063 RepID=W2VP21_PHYNI|nr:hypothetical protein F441_22481 [Phytophthora nicotianae CJ01A1]